VWSNLEVAREDDNSLRRAQRIRHAVGDAVRHANRLYGDAPHLKRRSGLDGVQGRVQPPLAEFLLNQGERQRRAVNRQLAQAGQQIRQRAHMVFVPVRQQNRLQLVADA
jgi:hypothetical protein